MTIARGSQFHEQVEPEVYTITAIAEVEKDGEVTSLTDRDALKSTIFAFLFCHNFITKRWINLLQ